MTRGDILENQHKLQSFFDSKYESLVDSYGTPSDQWIDYCDSVKVSIVDPESIQRYFNENASDYICIGNPEPPESAQEFYWLLVPLDLAERALMLGGIP